MKRIKGFFLAVIFVLFTVLVYGCSQQASKRGGGRSYFPNEEGYTCLLRHEDGTGTLITAEGTVVIPGDITVQSFKSSYLDASGTLISTGEEYMKVTDAGVYHYGIPSIILDPAAVLLDFPLTVGKSWTVSSGADVTTANVTDNENVTVSAGTFDCYKVSYITTHGTIEVATSTVWYGDGAGIVKAISSSWPFGTVLEWKSF